jgi:hypothetical protein
MLKLTLQVEITAQQFVALAKAIVMIVAFMFT